MGPRQQSQKRILMVIKPGYRYRCTFKKGAPERVNTEKIKYENKMTLIYYTTAY